MNFSHYASAITLILSCLSSLHGEYIVIKKTGGSISAVTQKDAQSKETYETLLKYQWPTCLATIDNLETNEKSLLFSDKPYAEETFIRNKLKKIENTYDIIFVPTVVYELFSLLPDSIAPNALSFSAARDIDTYSDENNKDIKRLSGWSAKELVKILGDNQKKKSDVLTFFDNQNKSEATYNAFFKINEELLTYLKNNGFFKNVTTCVKSETINELIKKLLSEHKNNKNSLFNHITEISNIFSADQNVNQTDTQNFLLYKIALLEYEAREKNKALLYRGLSPFESHVAPNVQGKVLDVSTPDAREIKKLITPDTQNPLITRSLSYGNSCFGGIINDMGASAYYYFGYCNFGYALSLDKKQYVQGNLKQLFFVSPLSTLNSLFAFGEFFHSRSRYCAHEEPNLGKDESIAGWDDYYPDKTGLIFFHGDPLEQISKITAYINKDNVRMLIQKDKQNNEINFNLNDQERAAKLYQLMYPWARWKNAITAEKNLKLSNLTQKIKSWNRVISSFDEFDNTIADFIILAQKIKKNTACWLGNETPKKDNPHIIRKTIVNAGSKVLLIGDLKGNIKSLVRNLTRLNALGYLNESLRLTKNTYLIFMLPDTDNDNIEVLYTMLQLFIKNKEQVIILRDINKSNNTLLKNLKEYFNQSDEKEINELIEKISNTIYQSLPVTFFLGCNDAFIQCCNKLFDLKYNPTALLESNNKLKRMLDVTMRRAEKKEDKCKNLKAMLDKKTTEFQAAQYKPTSSTHYSNEKVPPNAYAKVNAFFTGYSYDTGCTISNHGSWNTLKKNQSIKLNEDGFPFDSFKKSTFSFSSFGDEDENNMYDCIGILTIGKKYEDWRLIPYETPTKNQYNFSKKPNWGKNTWLLNKDLTVTDCLW